MMSYVNQTVQERMAAGLPMPGGLGSGNRDLKRGLIAMCAAGGMAPAMIIERV